MSIFDKLFGSTPAPTPAPGAQGTAAQPLPGTQSGTGTAPNGVVPAQGTDPNTNGNPGKVDESPLAKHADIWNIPDTAKGNEPQPIFANLDPAKIMESAKKVNFAGQLSPEVLEKIKAGGDGAVQALAESLNNLGQAVYGQSAVATAKIVEQALTKAQEQYDSRIPTMMKKLTASETLRAENPLFDNPAIQPLVGALNEVLVRKNPNASSKEIADSITDYLKTLGGAFAPAAPADPSAKPKSKETDWSTFLDS